jgi:hypothetical protein
LRVLLGAVNVACTRTPSANLYGVVYHLVAGLFDPATRAIEALTAALPRS